MSDWIGANTYRIENFQNRGAAVAVRAGTTDVVQKSNMADAADVENLWTIAYVGVGYSKKDEYLIINRGSCKWLNASGPAPTRQGQLTVNNTDPAGTLCRWNITPTRNNTGTFILSPSWDNSLRLTAESETTADGAKIMAWKMPLSAKGTWWYLELVPTNAEIQTLNLGQAPKHCGH